MGSALVEIKINLEADKNLKRILNAEESDYLIFWKNSVLICF